MSIVSNNKVNKGLPWKQTYRVSNKKKKYERQEQVLRLTIEGNDQDVIATKIRVKSRMTVYRIQNELIKLGKLTRDQVSGTLIKKLSPQAISQKMLEEQSSDAFFQEKCIKTWEQWFFGKHDKNDPKQIRSFRRHVHQVFVTCQTVGTHPDAIIFALTPEGHPDFVKALEDLLTQFNEHVQNNTVQYVQKTARKIRHDGATNNSIVGYAKSWASLLDAHSKTLPKQNTKSILSRAKKNYGKYSEVYLTDGELSG